MNDSIYEFSISGKFSEKLHCWNVVTIPYCDNGNYSLLLLAGADRSLLHHRLLLCLRGAGTLKTFKEDKKLFILNRVIQLQCRVIVECSLGAEQGFVLLVGKVRMRTNSKISASLV